jgi:hypothetical protein
MDKPSTYLLITYFPTYLAISETYFLTELVNKAKPNIISVEVRSQLSNNRHPVDGALVGPGSLWPIFMSALIPPIFYVHISFTLSFV